VVRWPIRFAACQGAIVPGNALPEHTVVIAATDPVRVFTLLHDARPLLLNFGDPGSGAISSWADRVRLLDAKTDGPWELPVLGTVPAPAAVLIRPDGHVAWVGDPNDLRLQNALSIWFGPPVSA
jgi:3-(3-hydroxy-phenyl)propionate hydroxylase